MLGLGATRDGDVAVIVGSSTCHLAQSREGVFGSGAGGCYPDATVEGLYTLEAGQTATGSILDWYRRHFAGDPAAGGRAPGRPRLRGARRAGRGGAARLRGAGRPRRLAGEPLALQEPAGPRRDRRPVAGARPRPRLPRDLRGHGLRHAAHPRGRRGPRAPRRADLPGRRRCASRPSGSRSTPTSSRSPSTWPARARPAPWARRWPRPSRPGSMPTSTRPPARWSPSRSRRADPGQRGRLRRAVRAICRSLRPAQRPGLGSPIVIATGRSSARHRSARWAVACRPAARSSRSWTPSSVV